MSSDRVFRLAIKLGLVVAFAGVAAVIADANGCEIPHPFRGDFFCYQVLGKDSISVCRRSEERCVSDRDSAFRNGYSVSSCTDRNHAFCFSSPLEFGVDSESCFGDLTTCQSYRHHNSTGCEER